MLHDIPYRCDLHVSLCRKYWATSKYSNKELCEKIEPNWDIYYHKHREKSYILS